jgi:hypothetical protein
MTGRNRYWLYPSWHKLATRRATAQAKTDGKSANARHSATMIAMPMGKGMPPYWTTTRDTQ